MDLQTYLDNALLTQRSKALAKSDQLTLGELILKLEPIVEKQKQRKEDNLDEATVRFDFEYLFPTELDSWRGSYSELALNFQTEGHELTVTEFYKMVNDAVGKEYTGYKGGEFTMTKRTPIWVANYGHSGNTALIDVVDNDYTILLITGYREF